MENVDMGVDVCAVEVIAVGASDGTAGVFDVRLKLYGVAAAGVGGLTLIAFQLSAEGAAVLGAASIPKAAESDGVAGIALHYKVISRLGLISSFSIP